MYHDLCIPYTASQSDLQRTLSFLVELSYSVIAISLPLPSGPQLNKQQPFALPTLPQSPPGLKQILTRLTLPLLTPSDLPSAKLHTLQQIYDLVVLRPTSERTLLLATSASEPDLISLDLSARWPFHFRPRMFSAAVKRGVYFEICYSAGLTDSRSQKSSSTTGRAAPGYGELIPASDAATARRNLVMNATSLVRALRGGRNVVFSSEAASVLGLRAPLDVVNLGRMWEVGAEVAMEAITEAPATVVRAAKARRGGWKGVMLGVQVVGLPDGEDKRGVKRKVSEEDAGNAVTKRVDEVESSNKPLSKRQMKRLARRERAERQEKDVEAVPASVDDKT